jgi:ureidoglycolate hydrolase
MREDIRTIDVELQAVSELNFAAYGEILYGKSSVPAFTGKNMQSWRIQFSIDGKPELMLNRFYFQPFDFSKMERHLHVTQTFIPLGNVPMIMVVSAPTKADDWSSIPKPEEIRAFYLDGAKGIMMWKGTWHALHRFPAHPPYVDIGLITEAETQKELELELAEGRKPRRTQTIDYEELMNINFRIIDPLKHIGP